MTQGEAPRWQALVVSCGDGAGVLDVGGIHVGSEWSDERMEDIGAEGYEGWERGVGWREGDLEA